MFDGPRPVLRDYTPARFDAPAGGTDIEVAPARRRPRHRLGRQRRCRPRWVGIAGPRGSMVVPTGVDWHWLLGDETALPAIARRLAELPASAVATVRIQLNNPADQQVLASAAQVDLQWVNALPAAVEALALHPARALSGPLANTAMAAVRRAVLAKPGVDRSACASPPTGSAGRQTTMKTWSAQQGKRRRPLYSLGDMLQRLHIQAPALPVQRHVHRFVRNQLDQGTSLQVILHQRMGVMPI